MELKCQLYGEDPTSSVEIAYTDFAGLEQIATITINRDRAAVCGDTTCTLGETCSEDCSEETYCFDYADNDEDTFLDYTDSDCIAAPS